MRTLLLVLTGVAALTNWSTRFRANRMLENVSKPLTTALVIALALASGAPSSQVVVAVIALALCLMGDVFLLPSVDRFVPGLASFLLGHVVFVVLFFQFGLTSTTLAGIAIVLAALLAGTIGRVIVAGAAHADAALRKPVLAYLFVISSMGVFGWATGRWWVVAGTTLFVLSDSVLGWARFVRERPWMSPVVMITYHAAIVSLALSLW
ncbi:MAG: hypothetical protein RI900_989 [Actinomycetota bacterium]